MLMVEWLNADVFDREMPETWQMPTSPVGNRRCDLHKLSGLYRKSADIGRQQQVSQKTRTKLLRLARHCHDHCTKPGHHPCLPLPALMESL